MKRSLLRLVALTLAFTVGAAISLVTNHRSDEPSLTAENLPKLECESMEPFVECGPIVISVPDADEFYLGKRQVQSSEIADSVLTSFANRPRCPRKVFIKSAAKVKFETLYIVRGFATKV